MSIDEQLRGAAQRIQQTLDGLEVPEPPHRHPRRGWPIAVAVAAVVVIVVGVAVPPAVRDGDSGPLGSPDTPPTTAGMDSPTTEPARLPDDGPIFGVGNPSDAIVLMDDGLQGLIAVDLDRRVAARVPVEGQRAGDEPYSMVRVGDSLVVGWGTISAVDISTGASTEIGRATIFVPGVEDDRVWLVDWPEGFVGGGVPTVSQVTLDGEVVVEPSEVDVDGFPGHGTSRGIAFETARGLVLWDHETGDTELLSPSGRPFVLDAHGDEVAWCHGDCGELIVTDITTGLAETLPAPNRDEGFTLHHGGFRAPNTFSPDGRFLAALLGNDDERRLWIHDRGSGTSTDVGDDSIVDYVAWGPSGPGPLEHVYATSWSYGMQRTVMWRYDVRTGDFAAVTLPFGGGLSPVVIESGQGDWIPAAIPEGDCGEPQERCPIRF